MDPLSTAWVIPAAFALDILVGDPPTWPHPVRWMGRAIEAAEPVFRRLGRPVLAGGLFAVVLIVAAWVLARGLVAGAGALSGTFQTLVEVVLLACCLSARSLSDAAAGIARALIAGNLPLARQRTAMVVSRHTDTLDRAGLSRSAIETVAENFVDGFVSPLLFAVIGGVPAAVAFKMISTLDSMVGYKNERYILFGKVAARIDDVANLVGARLSVVVIAAGARILGGPGRRTIRVARAEGRHHASPNAGYPEAAFAGALGVRLAGPAVYHGRFVDKPFFGREFEDPGVADIGRARVLMIVSAVLVTAVLTLVAAIV